MIQEEWTIGKLQNWATNYLESKDVPDAKRSIDLIICQIMNLERIDLYLKFDLPLNQFELNEIKDKIKRLISGEPLQYVMGEVEFYGLKFKVNESVLIPRPETEELVDLIVEDNKLKKDLKILDIGCGSGCIGISLAKKLFGSKVFSIDISEGAIELSKSNANLNDAQNIEFYVLDILNKVPKTKFDVIVSNPPYISTKEFDLLDKNVREFEPRVALTDEDDGLKFYRRFYELFEKMLEKDGIFYFENSFDQGEKLLEAFSKKYNSMAISDINGIKRFIKGSLK